MTMTLVPPDAGSVAAMLAAYLASRQPAIDNAGDYLRAAVLLPLVELPEGGAGILFEVRSSDLAWQPGEVCFPGGRIEPEDKDPAVAARRETAEELGIAESDVRVIGSLNYLVSPIGVLLHPYVGYIQNIEAVRPNRDEVAEIFTVPLAWLVQAEPIIGQMEVATRPAEGFPLHLLPPHYQKDWRRRSSYEVLFYPYGKHVVWGLTARILKGFIDICLQAWAIRQTWP